MADFMILPGRNLHSNNVAVCQFMEQKNKKKKLILRWLVGVNWGSFLCVCVRLCGQEVKKC